MLGGNHDRREEGRHQNSVGAPVLAMKRAGSPYGDPARGSSLEVERPWWTRAEKSGRYVQHWLGKSALGADAAGDRLNC